jgi:hypothetical protein
MVVILNILKGTVLYLQSPSQKAEVIIVSMQRFPIFMPFSGQGGDSRYGGGSRLGPGGVRDNWSGGSTNIPDRGSKPYPSGGGVKIGK